MGELIQTVHELHQTISIGQDTLEFRLTGIVGLSLGFVHFYYWKIIITDYSFFFSKSD